MHSKNLICVEVLSDIENSGLYRCRIRQVPRIQILIKKLSHPNIKMIVYSILT